MYVESDKELLEKLHACLDQACLKIILKQHCEKEITHLRSVLNTVFKVLINDKFFFAKRNEDALFIDIMQILKKMITNIDQEEVIIQHEMQGIQNYSAYESQRIKAFIPKKQLRDEIEKMLQVIRDA